MQGNATPTAAYWYGGYLNQGGTANANWGGYNASTITTNWSSVSSGTLDAGQLVGGVSDVVFAAANLASSGAINSTLDAPFAINSLTVTNTAATDHRRQPDLDHQRAWPAAAAAWATRRAPALSSSPAQGPLTISASNVVPAASQSWSNNSASLLTVSANVTGNATAGNTTILTLAGTGSGGSLLSGTIGDGSNAGNLAVTVNTTGGPVTLSGSNTYTGGTTLTAGTLNATSNTALSTGSVTMNPSSGTGRAEYDQPRAVARRGWHESQLGCGGVDDQRVGGLDRFACQQRRRHGHASFWATRRAERRRHSPSAATMAQPPSAA